MDHHTNNLNGNDQSTGDWNDFVSDLTDGELVIVEGPAPKALPTVTLCRACNGTGRMTSGRFCMCPAGHSAKRAAFERKAKIVTNQRERALSWAEHNPIETEFLRKAAEWSSFARDMLEQTGTVKGLSDRQLSAVRSMMAKCAQRDEQRAAERARSAEQREKVAAVVVDLAPIRAMFEAAVSNGHKKPTYRAEGLVINRAPDTGSNPGALYVKAESGEYLGKLIGTSFKPVRGGEAALGTLTAIATNPLEAAIRYGRKTGRCACCGRELTNAESIELGIGPICRDKWGL